MNSWNNHFTNMIALRSRAKNLETTLQFKKMLEQKLSPSEVLSKLQKAEDIKKLYNKAYRMCLLLQDTQDKDSTVDMNHVRYTIERSLRRINDILKVLNTQAEKWGIGIEEVPKTKRMPTHMLNELIDENIETLRTPPSFSDFNSAKDIIGSNPEELKLEIKRLLKNLVDVLDDMETSTLLKIRRSIKKLTD